MKVLWFTNIMLPGHFNSSQDTIRHAGGWMAVLLEEVLHRTDFTLAVVTTGAVKRLQVHSVGRADYYLVPEAKGRHRLQRQQLLSSCSEIIRSAKPDIVHIHGTERPFGLLSAHCVIKTPTIISIQGLLGPYSEWYHYFGNKTLVEVFRINRWIELLALKGLLRQFWNCKHRAQVEFEIIRGNKYFMGRTFWDHAHIKAINPTSTYFTVGELLRKPFWNAAWQLKACQRHRIIFTNAGHPRKGAETLLDCIPLLKNDYPDIQVCIAGKISKRSGYGRYIKNKVLALHPNVIELGAINADEMAHELIKSHVFVSPSYIDNSPNALCEAQMVGMPVIATYTGGVPSLVEHGRTGLFFPTGDLPTLAARIRQIFDNDSLACQLGTAAHKAATIRHDPDTVVMSLVAAYENILRSNT